MILQRTESAVLQWCAPTAGSNMEFCSCGRKGRREGKGVGRKELGRKECKGKEGEGKEWEGGE